MAKAVFTVRPGSVYDDLPEERYHFPRTYLRAAQGAVGDWILYYEPRRDQGRQAYIATARVTAVDPDPSAPDHYYARIADCFLDPLFVLPALIILFFMGLPNPLEDRSPL